jgi:transcriptional accessory protein Tex/SPT6
MKLAEQFNINESKMKIIIEALTMRKDEDIRSKLERPLFSIQSIDDLNIGSLLNDIVRNITLFGIFVDIGIGVDGLAYITQMKNRVLNVGQRVEVEVINIEPNIKQINLEIVRTL